MDAIHHSDRAHVAHYPPPPLTHATHMNHFINAHLVHIIQTP
jgi:hypothetical protein